MMETKGAVFSSQKRNVKAMYKSVWDLNYATTKRLKGVSS